MRRRIYSWTEAVSLVFMVLLATLVLIADPLGFERLLPVNVIPKVTLLVLCTITVFLLVELKRLQLLDNVDDRLASLDIEAIAREQKKTHYAGIAQVHHRFPDDLFIRHISTAKTVTILNTWIPNLSRFAAAIVEALERGATVRVLLLFPRSGVAQLRDEALRTVRDPVLADNVKDGVYRCLATLESIAESAGQRAEGRLQVRVYNSLPSIAVYRTDEHYFISTFLHGQLAIDSPQFEIDGAATVLGKQVQNELDTLWRIGGEIDPLRWRGDLDRMSL